MVGTHRLARALGVLVAVAALTVSVRATGADARTGASPSRHLARATLSLQIPDTSYPVPADALFVAPTGDDANPGSQDLPFLTLQHALAVAPFGATVVLRAGVYRESFGDVVRPVTIQPYPDEQAWLSGSDVVTGWDPVDDGLGDGVVSAWVHHGWTTQLCHTCFAQDSIDWTNYPLAGWPDQVFFNGTPFVQVDDVSKVAPGTFYADYANQDLYVGSDPVTDPSLIVEATTRAQAGTFQAGAVGSIVRGIGIMQYGPNWNEGTTGEIMDRAANMRFENDVFTQSANRGLFVLNASNVAVVDTQFVDNGFTGLYTRGSNYLDMERNILDNNNTERFWDGFSNAAGAGGAKISASYHVMVKGNSATNNWGNGIWNDVSSYDVDYIDNFAAHNDRNGLYIEITGTSIVASNLSIFNGQAGLKLSGATSARVYNNTFADNATYQASVHDDGRNQTDPAKIALGITWNTSDITFVNNVLAAPAGGSLGPLLYTENSDKPVIRDAASMIAGMDYDLWTRADAANPPLAAAWIHPAPIPTSKYTSLSTFQSGTGYDMHGVEVSGYSTSPVFTAPDQGDYSALVGGPANWTGTPLPADIAALIGATPDVAVDRGALIYPGSSPLQQPPPPPPPPPPTVYVTDTFSRTVANGWGKADKGGAWGITPKTVAWGVNGATGTVTAAKGQQVLAGVTPLRTTDADFSTSFTSSAPRTAQPKWSCIVRNVNGQHQYRARVRVTAAGAVVVGMTRLLASKEVLIGTELTVPGLAYAPGTLLRIRTEAVGTAPTTLRAKVWLASAAEPTVWQIVQTDTEASMQVAGSFGLLAVTPAGANLASTITFDDLAITSSPT